MKTSKNASARNLNLGILLEKKAATNRILEKRDYLRKMKIKENIYLGTI